MSQDYPPFDDDQETRRRSNTPLVPSERQGPQKPMARPVFPQTDRTQAHRPVSGGSSPLPPEPESSGLYVPWWGFVLVILAVAGLTCGLWGVVLISRGDGATSVRPTHTMIFVMITPTVTLSSGG